MNGHTLGQLYSHLINNRPEVRPRRKKSHIVEKIDKKGSLAISELRKIERKLQDIEKELGAKYMEKQVKVSDDKEIQQKLSSIKEISTKFIEICKHLETV